MIYLAVKGQLTLAQGSRLKLRWKIVALFTSIRASADQTSFDGLKYLTSRARGAASLTIPTPAVGRN
jgi:hypothetical protein